MAPNMPTPTAMEAMIASPVVRSVTIFSGMIGALARASTHTVAASSSTPPPT
ncbi:Uncharacterised protein [Mycobacteroides abscessus subsp. abscessus]|nr:Uncharacterised protein [Mycobacteroides abscessus subsp. abscessus]